ncbi:MAG: dockerin type I repeat-containing protein [Candidatus Glassbacteria bacterium]
MLTKSSKQVTWLSFLSFLFCWSCLVETAHGQSSPILAVKATRGDINQDSSCDIYDLLVMLKQITNAVPQTASADLDDNGRVNVFDLLELLRELAFQQELRNAPLAALVTLDEYLLCEPMLYLDRSFDDNGEVRCYYAIYANRKIQRVEFALAGDTLTEVSGKTPLLMAADPDTFDLNINKFSEAFVYTEPMSWLLSVWDSAGNCFTDSGRTSIAVMKIALTDVGGSPNIGLPIEFPLKLTGRNQKFGIVHPYAFNMGEINYMFIIDLNKEGRESVVFSDMGQLTEAIMKDVLANEFLWNYGGMFDEKAGFFVSSAVSRATGDRTNRLLIFTDMSFHRGGYVELKPVAGNERILSALGFPKWIRDIMGHVYNKYYLPDTAVVNKYK